MGRLTVRNVVESAGRGGWRKRMIICNGWYKGSKFALTRKCAHFHLVFNHIKRWKAV